MCPVYLFVFSYTLRGRGGGGGFGATATTTYAMIMSSYFSQASLKNFLRAVLAIQHRCVRGSIPVWRPRGGVGGKQSKQEGAEKETANAALRGELAEFGATGRMALSL